MTRSKILRAIALVVVLVATLVCEGVLPDTAQAEYRYYRRHPYPYYTVPPPGYYYPRPRYYYPPPPGYYYPPPPPVVLVPPPPPPGFNIIIPIPLR